jgi:tetratricopeptide (TPR) repeat protein
MGESQLFCRKRRMRQRIISSLISALLLSFFPAFEIPAQAPSAPTRDQAAALEQQGNFPEAEIAWRQVLKAQPASAEAYAHLGFLEARQEHYKDAVPLYRKALALNPSMPGLHLNLGLALFKGGEPKAAIQQFQLVKPKAGSPEAQRVAILLGMAHYGQGEYADAVPYLKQAAVSDPQNLELRLALAHSCLWSKQYQCVLDTYHEILTLNAESAEADMLAGEAEDEMKEYDGAIEQFRAAVKANPNEPDVHFGLGYILWTQRRYAEAEPEFKAELANNPNHAQSLAYLGDTEIQLNHPELAPPYLEKARGIEASIELPHLDLGILYADAGRNDEALTEMKAAAKLAPDDINVHWRLGRLYRTMGQKELANAEFDKANSLHRATDNALLERMSGDHAKPPAPTQ